jgi:hypothetical protein
MSWAYDHHHNQINGLTEGDRINVYSAGTLLDAGVFVRVQGRFLIWVDANLNTRSTDLDTISITKVS